MKEGCANCGPFLGTSYVRGCMFMGLQNEMIVWISPSHVVRTPYLDILCGRLLGQTGFGKGDGSSCVIEKCI